VDATAWWSEVVIPCNGSSGPESPHEDAMKIPHDRLGHFTTNVFTAAGCSREEAARIAAHLVEANLVGHDSHGVIRVASYVQWLRDGKVAADQTVEVVFENDVIAVVDGQCGFGQTVGAQAMQLGIAKSARHGVAIVALRNSGHLGRIGDWPLMAARAGKLSMHFVNTTGAGILVAPFGGINRRLSANPIAAGIPVAGGSPILLDMSACTIAEGKIRVALNKGVAVPENCIIDAEGRPTTDPRVFYADPPGAILSIGGHKGYGLGILCEVLAGALTGGGCSNPQNAGRVLNGMLSIILDPAVFQSDAAFAAEIQRFVAWVKSSAPASVNGEILMPGEIEERTRAHRLRDGIDLDEATWAQLQKTAEQVGVTYDPGQP
jgi:hydroxycarboxylate dehydrogenase B